MKLKGLLLTLLVGLGLASCSNDNVEESGINVKGSNTYMNLSINLPGSNKTRALPDDYNPAGTYEGNDWVNTLDIYMKSADGTIEAKRFVRADLSTDGSIITPNQPFRTTSGSKTIYVVLNNPAELGTTITEEDELVNITGLAQITTQGGTDYDLITMTGKTASTIYVDPDITQQQVVSGQNRFGVEVERIASRVIVTTEAAEDLYADDGTLIGKFTGQTYAVAQGTKKVYWLGQPDFYTYGTDYVPVLGTYDEADTYYDYSDLEMANAEVIPAKDGDNYKSLKGKFLFENTHKEGDVKTSEYKKGNTAYVLVRTTFEPDPAVIVDQEPLVNGTFYVGQSDGQIYGNKENARQAVQNQKIATYQGGKMIYFAWLNPDNVAKPYNSPVVRNNIYHINITGFKNLGYTWNPLFPGSENPDPKPSPEEPEIPIDPIDPLSPEETFMTVDVTILDWVVHSYDIEL